MKQKFLRLSMMVIAMMAFVSSFAYDACINGIYYNIIVKAKKAEVTFSDDKYTGAVTIPETFTYDGVTYSVTSIGDKAFKGCSGLTSITIPNSVTSIGIYAFYDCFYLRTVTIGNSVTSISDYAFAWCSDLTSVTIPNSVTSIGDFAFYKCSGLTSVTIPNSVTSIGQHAFSNCSGLTSITIPNSVTSIGNSAFFDCSGLTSIQVENGNTHYDSRDDCNAIIKTSSNELIAGCKNTIIPNSVTSIGGAFGGCTGLTSITIPNSVTSIGASAFCRCTGLTSITIPNSVASIGISAFYNCSGLTSVTIPNSVASIGDNAFKSCKNIENVYCYAEKVPSTVSNAFEDSYTEYATLYVPKASIDVYKTTAPWSNFGTFKAIETGQEPAVPDTCATPTISIVNGKLHFECETEGAKIHYTVTQKTNDLSADYDDEDVDFMTKPSYTVTAYATAEGYIDSEKVTKTITANNADVNGDGTVDISDVNGVISVICGNDSQQ